MKRTVVIIIGLMIAASLTGCGVEATNDTVSTSETEDNKTLEIRTDSFDGGCHQAEHIHMRYM